MSKKKIPSGEELSEVKVDVRHKKHRREPESSEMGKHWKDVELSTVKVEGVRQKNRRDTELGDVGKHKQRREAEPSVLKDKQRRNTHTAAVASPYDEGKRGIPKVSSRSSDFVYDNKAYVGSLNNVNEARILEPPTSVYREQYWACTKWSFAKKVLAIAAGVALGAGIGLAIILVLTGKDAEEVIGGIFLASAPD